MLNTSILGVEVEGPAKSLFGMTTKRIDSLLTIDRAAMKFQIYFMLEMCLARIITGGQMISSTKKEKKVGGLNLNGWYNEWILNLCLGFLFCNQT